MDDLLRECVRTILERIVRAGFSLGELKKLASVEEVMNYAKNHLTKLGQGSSRAAFLLSSRYVLKVAKNDKGFAQNEAEVDVFTNPSSKPIVAKIQDFDPGYKWLVSELVRPLRSPYEFTSLTGMIFHRFIGAVEDTISGYDVERALQMNKLEPDAAKMVLAAADTINFNDLSMADVNVVDHWGKTPDGRVVILDYGFTKGIARTHYMQSNTESGSEPETTVDQRGATAKIGVREKPTGR